MKLRTALTTILISTAIVSAAQQVARTAVTWQTLGNTVGDDAKHGYTQRLTVRGDKDFDFLCFNMFARRMQPLNPADTVAEIFPGYYRISSPRLHNGADTVQIDIRVNWPIPIRAYAPDGLHRVNRDGTTEAVAYTRMPMTHPRQWTVRGHDAMPYGPQVYALNQARATDTVPGVYDIIPAYKKVTLTGGTSRTGNPQFVAIDPENPDYYRIEISGDSLRVFCRPDRQWTVMHNFTAKVLMPNQGQPLPNAVIENWPDLPWRGLHIDIARNCQKPADMYPLLQIMSANHLNKLHFHFADDEGWRLQSDAVPELNTVGARRGYSNHGEDRYLYQIFAGDGNPDNNEGTANGWWTRAQFIDFLRTAKLFGIDVLPEVESPGHARAAIRATEARHRGGDSSLRLVHDGDSSRFSSAQSYRDNVMNPALPGPYKFMALVFDELIDMYREAGVPLIGIHIGGDEVPRNAWAGSQTARQFMQDHGMTSEKQLHAYFVKAMADSLAARGVPMYGWEEVAVGHGDDFNGHVAPLTGGVHCWHDTPEAAQKAVAAGYPVILANVNRFYLDMAASGHPEEQGLNWGGTVDEFDALHGYADQLCPGSKDAPGNVIGVQGQLWSETIRSPRQMYAMLLPKLMGLAERAWNTTPTHSDAMFNAIIGQKELPVYTGAGNPVLDVHMRQPGITVIGGMVHMNAPYAGGVIHYTTDGTEPDQWSPVYTAPFALPHPDADIRARYTRDGATSVTTYLAPRD